MRLLLSISDLLVILIFISKLKKICTSEIEIFTNDQCMLAIRCSVYFSPQTLDLKIGFYLRFLIARTDKYELLILFLFLYQCQCLRLPTP